MKKLLLVSPLLLLSAWLFAQPCTANWTFDDTNLTIQFTDLSTTTSGTITNWFWDFDDGTTSTVQNPLHTFAVPDKYDVELTITTSTGCTDKLKILIEICEFAISIGQGACNANGQVPVTITVNDIYGNAKEIDITLDGVPVPGSPFDIEETNPIVVTVNVPGDGLQHTVNVQSTDIPTCNEAITFTVDDCNSNCFLSSLAVNFSGGTTKTVIVGPGGNNSFSPVSTTIVISDVVSFVWQDNGHSSTSDATSGPDSWNSGVIGIGSTFNVTIKNPGVHNYYCIPHGGPGGSGMSGNIVANCPAGNNFTLNITFNTTQANAAGYNVLIDGVVQPGSPHNYNGTGPQSVTATMPGDGLTHEIKIQDVADPACFVMTNFIAPDCGAAPQCSLSVTAIENGGCNANNQVPVSVTVTAINPGAQGFHIKIDGANAPGGPFPYNASGPTTVTVNVPGDGQSHTIQAVDVATPTCIGSVNITTTNCAIPCSLTNLTASTGSSQTHVVLVQDFSFNPQHITITSGDVINWQWTGAIQHTSTSDATSGPNSWNSSLLGNGATFTSPVLAAGVHPYYCVPHGAPGGVGMSGTVTVQANCTNGMVSVAVSFNETGGGFGGFNVKVDGVITPGSPYAYAANGANSVAVNITGDGASHNILVEDVDNPTCSATTTIITPNCNAPTCQLTVTAQESGGCNANNQVPVNVTVNAVGAGNQGFNVKIDGNLAPGSPFSYTGASTTVTINVPGDGASHTILVEDVAMPSCNASTTLTTTNCTIPCSLTNLAASTGSSTAHPVLVKDFSFDPKHITITSGDVIQWQWVGAVAHTATSDATSGPNSWNSGLLNNGATYTSPVLTEGVHPYYCIPHGAPGGVGMAGTVTVVANCNNGMVSVNLSFDETGGSFNGFRVLVDGIAVDTFAYNASGSNSVSVNIIGDGLGHNIAVQDLGNPNCEATTNITTPDCNFTPVCQINLAATSSACNANSQVPVTLTVSALNAGSGFNLFIDGNAYAGNPVSYAASGNTTVNLTLPGDGNIHTFIVRDVDDNTCADTTSLTLPNCSSPCSMSNLTLATGGSGNPATHTVQVKDFEFLPKNITVTVGDIVHWVWTGQIPHTTTSDATSGPLAWDSGLLGNGATYDITVSEGGTHPYYCIPHGAPGGIGMAGTITANPPCNNGQVAVTLTFEAANGGTSGFNVKVDGTTVPGSPFTYSATGTNTVNINVPGDGNTHTITVIDVTDPACTISGNISTPNCGGGGGNCALAVTAQQTAGCNSQNQIQVQLTVTHSNTGSGFNVKVGGNLVAGSPFSYNPGGTTVLTIPVTGTGQNRIIIVEDLDSTACTAQTQILTPLCGPACLIENLSASASGNKHIVEVRDFEFVPANLNVVVGDTVEFVWTGFIPHTTTSDASSGPNSWNSGLLGNGATYQIVITSPGNHPCYCIPHGGPNGIGMAGVISATDPCNNGLASVTVSFTVTSGSPLGYKVFVDGQLVPGGPFQYQNPTGANSVMIQVPGNGGSHLVTVQDLDINYCAATAPFTVPDCPVLCLVENLSVTTGGNVVHTVEVTDFDFIPNDLTVRTGETVHFVWTGAIPHSSTSDAISGPDSWNSGIHGAGFTYDISLQNAGDHPCYCIPHGGPGGIGQSGLIHAVEDCENGQVSVSISFSVTSGSPGGYKVFVDGVMYPGGPFAYDNPAGFNQLFITIPGDGLTHNVTVQDVSVNFCAATAQVTVPDCNAGCEITGLNVAFPQPVLHTVQVKDFEFVPKNLTINLGDMVKFAWTGQIPHTTTSDASSGPNSWESGLLGNGATYTLILENEGTRPYYCIPHGGPGGIGMAGTIVVENNGCQNGLITADLSFQSSNTGSGFNLYIDGTLQSGSPFNYGSGGNTLLTVPVPGDGNSHTISVTDADDPDCGVSLTVTPPLCPGDCSLQVSATQNGNCNPDDKVPYTVSVQSSNAGSSFSLKVDGSAVAGSPFAYNASGTTTVNLLLPGDGSSHSIKVSDVDSTGCTDLIEITTPNCSADCTPSITIAQSGGCNANDKVPYNLSVEKGAGAIGFNVRLDGTLYPGSPFPYTGNITVVPILLPGDGLPHQVIVSDQVTPSCSDTVSVTTPNCAIACSLSNLQIKTGLPIAHAVEVRDFDFFPANITVTTGDTVRFIWTGAVPHTATSDEPSGPNSWNSGLLGQGSVYEVVVQEIGEHPYYCIPHGGPGGIGMAGSVNVVGQCDDDKLWVKFTFDENNGGFGGFNVLLNGATVQGSPFPYQAGGTSSVLVEIPANGQALNVVIQDKENPACSVTRNFNMPDCDDPCFGYEASFTTNINHQTFKVQFTNTSNVTASTYIWSFGDGNSSTQQNPMHTYAAAGDYEVCLVINSSVNGCSDVLCQTISVGAYQCQANFTFEINGLKVSLHDKSNTSEQITQWMWNLGNNHFIAGQPNPTYTYPQLGVYTICLTITAGQCQSDTCFVVDLSDPCLLMQANYAYTVNHSNLSVQFIDLTGGGANQWLWGFGDGNTSNEQSPQHAYNQPGLYNVCLLVQNTSLGCNATKCQLVPVGVTGVSVLEIRNWKLKIFPNPSPANNFVWTMEGILDKDYGKLLGLKLYDMHGKTILNTKVQGKEQVVFSSPQRLTAGMYFVELKSEEGRYYRGKIIVQ